MAEHTTEDFTVAFEPATGVATLWMQMAGAVNKINAEFGAGFTAALDEALAIDGLKGLIIASKHRQFCAGADLDFIYASRDAEALGAMVGELHATFRRLETAGVPVVAAITGSAIAGGCELALACHHRVAINDPRIQLGLLEVQLGVIPGGGGTQRLPRMIGLQPALELLAQGTMVRAPKAVRKGYLDAVAEDANAVFEAANAWIAANPKAKQPWDRRGFEYPGGVQPKTAAARQLFVGATAMLTRKTAGAYGAPEAITKAVYEGTQIDFDSALLVERRYFVERVISDQAKDMLRTFWYHKSAVEKGKGLPRIKDARIRKVGILGAGMMGAGLAFISALRGYDVVLRDISQEALDAGLAHCTKQLGKRARHLDADAKQAVSDRIKGTLDVADLAGCDLIIEAVFENLALKHRVIAEVEAVLGEDAIFASNTSALPITRLLEVSVRPAQFIGMHFFSPVEQMPLLEVITAEATSDETLARVLAYARSLKKTTIVVNDGYGFYTTRLFAAYVFEATELVAQGHDPVLVERAARRAGMVVAPLKVLDEVTLTLAEHAFEVREAITGARPDTPGTRLVTKLLALGRAGKSSGAGFYDYDTTPRHLWVGLADLTEGVPGETGMDSIAERLMLAQALEAVRCLDEGILREKADAEIGAIMGVGFAPNSGGPLAWLDRYGIEAAVNRCDALASTQGARFEAPSLLRRMAAAGERFFEAV